MKKATLFARRMKMSKTIDEFKVELLETMERLDGTPDDSAENFSEAMMEVLKANYTHIQNEVELLMSDAMRTVRSMVFNAMQLDIELDAKALTTEIYTTGNYIPGLGMFPPKALELAELLARKGDATQH